MGDVRYVFVERQKSYNFWNFLVDCFMTCITCFFWLIWIFVREMRKR